MNLSSVRAGEIFSPRACAASITSGFRGIKWGAEVAGPGSEKAGARAKANVQSTPAQKIVDLLIVGSLSVEELLLKSSLRFLPQKGAIIITCNHLPGKGIQCRKTGRCHAALLLPIRIRAVSKDWEMALARQESTIPAAEAIRKSHLLNI
jgi:hypothetical protein